MFVRAAGGEGRAGFSFYQQHSAGKKTSVTHWVAAVFFVVAFLKWVK